MRLTKVGVRGYKRFHERQEMDVDSKLLAVVGANEAGKTSLLEALVHLNDGSEIQPGEETRNREGPNTPAVWARYVLDDEDRKAMPPEAKKARQLVVAALPVGGLTIDIGPEIHRDLTLRRRMLKALDRTLASRWLKETEGEEDEEIAQSLLAAKPVVESDDERLTSDELQPIRELVAVLDRYELAPAVATFRSGLDKLVKHELQPHPSDAAFQALDIARPRFLLFDRGARDLPSAHSIDDSPPAGLDNFLALAGTDWTEVVGSLDDEGRRTALEERAEGLLDEAFDAWEQSELIVRLRIRERTIHIQVRMEATHDYVGVEERSDGLRQFIALRAYIASQEVVGGPPVLLIDEAENHLHYDAQADLVDVLLKQEDAAKVIYTTHSAGCLPPDLGTGIRVVAVCRDENGGVSDDSEIINWFWTAEDADTGFTPLLLGMGAGTFAFASTRRALITEGISDAILLPMLFREVTGKQDLDFQIVPGLGNLADDLVGELDLAASRVAYLVDHDQGGRNRAKQLKRRGVPSKKIFPLGGGKRDVELEDLVGSEVYAAAVNEELAAWHNGAVMPESVVPDTGRHDAVAAWCSSHDQDIEAPAKPVIAHRIVEQRGRGQLVASRHRVSLRQLHQRIQALLAQPSHASS